MGWYEILIWEIVFISIPAQK